MISKRELQPFVTANNRLSREREAAKSRVELAARAAHGKRCDILDRLRRGESTGDRFRDYALASFGRYDDSEVERYRQLDAELTRNAGQLVLLSWYEGADVRLLLAESPLSGRGEVLYARRHFVYVGIHMGEGLDLHIGRGEESRTSCCIPVKNGHVRAWSGETKPQFLKDSGRFGRRYRNYLALKQPFQLVDRTDFGCHQRLDECHVIVGDSEVVEWLEGNESYDFLDFVRRKLGKREIVQA